VSPDAEIARFTALLLPSSHAHRDDLDRSRAARAQAGDE
jgi:hypothetical protein